MSDNVGFVLRVRMMILWPHGFILASAKEPPSGSIRYKNLKNNGLVNSLAPDCDQHYTSTKWRLHLVEVEHTEYYSIWLTAKQ